MKSSRINWGSKRKSTPGHTLLSAAAFVVILATVISLPGNRWWGVPVALAASVTVNSTTDVIDGDTSSIANLIATPGADGVISLREAITAANNTPGADIINFNIPGGGVQTISIAAPLINPLPNITEALTIDGLSQPGAAFGAPLIRLTGTGSIGDGFVIAASSCVIRGFVIDSFNDGINIMNGSGSRIEANFIGTNPAGTAADPNINGVLISFPSTNNIVGTNGDGAADAAEGNLISGNTRGVSIQTSPGNRVSGNRIGTDISGTFSIPNTTAGVLINSLANSNLVGTNGDGSADASEGNLISGNTIGVSIQNSAGNLVSGNRIGTDVAGAAAIPNLGGGVVVSGLAATDNIIGTDGDGSAGDAGEGNLISGNGSANLLISDSAANNRVAGNLIGPAADGLSLLTDRPAFCVGVSIMTSASNNVIGTNNDGTADAIEGNLISGNTSDGVDIADSTSEVVNNVIAGNMIGTDSTGVALLVNVGSGVSISKSANNNIGGTSTAQRNIISGNLGPGVLVVFGSSTGNRILGNSIFSNGGLGIALDVEGVTPNDLGDPDTGPNNFQNYPVITDARSGSNIIQFTLNSTPSTTFRIEFFLSVAPDLFAHGVGKTFIGSQAVTTDASGDFAGAFTSPTALPEGQVITATATDSGDNTSEFSKTSIVLGPTASSGMVTGRITDAYGNPVEGAVVRLSGGQSRKFITDANGNYQFDNVDTGGFYTVTPTRANFNFNPFNRTFSQIGNRTEAAFTGTSMGDNVNPLDTPEYFVRQEYVDVLGREPDEGGFNFWSDKINQCLSEPRAVATGSTSARDCQSTQRLNVAASFFIAEEFQQSGSFLYDMYAGALDRKPDYSEYAADRQQVVGGEKLETEKTVFAQTFVQRAEFMAKYQNAMTAEIFVDALLQTVQASGTDLSSERDYLIGAYKGRADLTQGRAAVVQLMADNATFKQAQYNSAFVQTEYFSYLRRDSETVGFDFWLNVVNSGGNYRGLVCSFITSAEYQNRFSRVVSRTNGECGR